MGVKKETVRRDIWEMKRIKVFIDSNIWFSAFYKKSIASNLIDRLFQKKLEIVVSESVLEEIVRNIGEKLPVVLPLVYRFFQEYPITVIKNPKIEQLPEFTGLAQRKDLPILVSALNYRCDFFVTGNKKDFKISRIKKRHHLLILNPREMLERFGKIAS